MREHGSVMLYSLTDMVNLMLRFKKYPHEVLYSTWQGDNVNNVSIEPITSRLSDI